MNNIKTTLSQLMILFLVVGFLSCSGPVRHSEPEGESPGSVIDTTESLNLSDSVGISINQILSIEWVEIENGEKGWHLIPYCDREDCTLTIKNDTITLNYGDGGLGYYKIKSIEKDKTIEKKQWKLKVAELIEESVKTGRGRLIFKERDTLSIYVKMIDADKTDWTIGSGYNNYHFTFLNIGFIDIYPKDSIDCSEFDKEYKNQE